MKHRLPFLIAILLVVGGLGSDSPKNYDATVQVDKLHGTWVRVKAEHNGHLLMMIDSVQTFRNQKWEEKSDGRLQAGTYTADPSRKLGHLDIVVAGDLPGARRKCIFLVEGDTLKIAINWGTGERPTTFNDAWLFVDTFKRVKK